MSIEADVADVENVDDDKALRLNCDLKERGSVKSLPWTVKDITFVGNYTAEISENGMNKSLSHLNITEDADDSSPVPDGGWGWLIVFITFFINTLVAGTTFTLGISIPPLWDHFNVSEAAAAVVGSVMILAIMSSGPIVGYLVSKYGCRPVMNIGGIIQFLGAFSSIFSKDLATMIVTFGLIGGIGLGFLYISSIIIIGYYFKKRIALASGIAMCGTSVGTFVFNPLREYLQDTLGWNKSTLVFGALGLLSSVLAMFLKLPEPEADLYTRLWNKWRKKKVEKPIEVQVKEPMIEKVAPRESKRQRLWKKLKESSPIENKILWAFLLSSALSMMGFAVPLVYMAEDAKNKEIPKTEAVFLLSIIALTDGIGRLLFGLFCQKTGISPLKIKTVWIIIACISAFLVPKFDEYKLLAVFSALIGLGYGSYIAMVLPIFVNLVEKKHIAAAVGAENLFSGISVAICAPVAGALYGAIGNLSTAFYYSGTSLGASAIVNFAIIYYLHRKAKRESPAK